MSCGKNTSRIMFRINPETFVDGEKIRIVNGWFFPRGKERRMRILDEDIPLILENIKHAYEATKASAILELDKQSNAALKAWETRRKEQNQI